MPFTVGQALKRRLKHFPWSRFRILAMQPFLIRLSFNCLQFSVCPLPSLVHFKKNSLGDRERSRMTLATWCFKVLNFSFNDSDVILNLGLGCKAVTNPRVADRACWPTMSIIIINQVHHIIYHFVHHIIINYLLLIELYWYVHTVIVTLYRARQWYIIGNPAKRKVTKQLIWCD